jgi:dTDP-4-amino-4,6-dideoxygalactose transaminase
VFAPWINGDSLATAEDICARHVCLPTSAVMSEDDARYVVESLESALERLSVS